MNVLVLGGTRFIGRHLVRKLIADGYNVTIATRGLSEDDYADKVHRIVFDRLDEQSIKDNLSCKYYDVVYDSLAYCSEDVRVVLDNIKCGKYIFISSTAVYNKHHDTKENDFDPLGYKLVWCTRGEFSYDEIKRQAECAVFQKYRKNNSIAVRFPFAVGYDDYTKRLYFYIEHIIRQKPMYIDNFDKQMAFVRSDEAGEFLAFLADSDYSGCINGASGGTISIKDIADYVEKKTGKKIILSPDGEKAPYNNENEYSINTDIAKSLGYEFTPLKNWIYELIDKYIDDLKVQ